MKQKLPNWPGVLVFLLGFLAGAIVPAGSIDAAPGAKAGQSSEERFLEGKRLYKGEGVERDETKAAALIRSAAEDGHVEAQGWLGYFLSKGIGVDRDEADAVVWMKKAADRGVASAQYNLGLMMMKGAGLERDAAGAVSMITRAAESGTVGAQATLAEYYHFGVAGVDKSPEKALFWARKAAEGGNAWAQNLYGMMLEWGIGVSMDRSLAMDWYRRSAEQGNAKAQASLGLLYAGGLVVERDPVEAYYWLWKSMEQGEATATNFLKDMIPGMTKEERHAALRRIGIEPVEEE